MKPLQGIKVVELARILAGPWAGQLLADLGAEVVKVEHPNGDDTRQWGPPFIGEDAAYFHSTNRGKTSVTIDFESLEGQKAVHELLKDADIIIENFKVGGLKKYGLDYETLAKQFPKLIYCSITGFGQTGDYAPRAGYDFIIQGMGGIMHLTGEAAGEPQKTGVAYVDIFTGTYSVVGILSALYAREKTGKGAQIDMALLDTQVSVLANQGMNYLATGKSPKRMGNAHPNLVPYQVYPCKDGHIIIATGSHPQFLRLCEMLGFVSDERFINNAERVKNRDILTLLIEAKTKLILKQDLLALCEANTIPAGAINDIHEVFQDRQVQQRGMVVELDGVPSIASPIVINGVRQVASTAAPKLNASKSSKS